MQAEELKQLKVDALKRLAAILPKNVKMLDSIDPRLTAYMKGVARNEPDEHNL